LAKYSLGTVSTNGENMWQTVHECLNCLDRYFTTITQARNNT